MSFYVLLGTVVEKPFAKVARVGGKGLLLLVLIITVCTLSQDVRPIVVAILALNALSQGRTKHIVLVRQYFVILGKILVKTLKKCWFLSECAYIFHWV